MDRLSLAAGAALLAAAFAYAQDDHGEQPESATLLGVGDTISGELGAGGGVDVFRIDVHGTADFEVRTTGPTDTTGRLDTAAGVHIASDEDSGPGDNFSITATLDAGVYYVTVGGSGGQYAVNARLAGRQDHGDTAAASTLLPLRRSDEIQRVSPTVLLAMTGRIAPTAADVDVFRIDVERETAVEIRSSPGSYDLDAVLSEQNGVVIQEDDGDGGFRIGRRLEPGTYYLSVSSDEVGAYRVLAQHLDFDTRAGAWGITVLGGRLYVQAAGNVHVYGLDGSRMPERGFSISGREYPFYLYGTTWVDGTFYTVDWVDRVLHAYDDSGQPVEGKAVTLATDEEDDANDNASPWGLTYTAGTFYVIDDDDDKVYAYSASGNRRKSREFELLESNYRARGIAHADGTFYVLDFGQQRMFRYDAAGNPVQGGFELANTNGYPTGLAYARGRLYVVDREDRKVYVYNAEDGQHLFESTFDLPGPGVEPD